MILHLVLKGLFCWLENKEEKAECSYFQLNITLLVVQVYTVVLGRGTPIIEGGI